MRKKRQPQCTHNWLKRVFPGHFYHFTVAFSVARMSSSIVSLSFHNWKNFSSFRKMNILHTVFLPFWNLFINSEIFVIGHRVFCVWYTKFIQNKLQSIPQVVLFSVFSIYQSICTARPLDKFWFDEKNKKNCQEAFDLKQH